MKFNSLVPELSVTDIQKSKQFYVQVLGFVLEYERPQNKFAFVSYCGSQIMLEQTNDNWTTGKLEYPFGRGINFQIETTEIEQIQQRLVQNNVPIYKQIFESAYQVKNTTYTEKELLVQDPDGYLLRFSQTIKQTTK